MGVGGWVGVRVEAQQLAHTHAHALVGERRLGLVRVRGRRRVRGWG